MPPGRAIYSAGLEFSNGRILLNSIFVLIKHGYSTRLHFYLFLERA